MIERDLPIARAHPAFDGHFPGHPILPGVVLLSEAMAAIEAETGREASAWGLASAKFLSAVAPGTALTLAHELLEGGRLRFEVRSAAGVVASGTLAPR